MEESELFFEPIEIECESIKIERVKWKSTS